MLNDPLISIVTPSYNQGMFIEDTLVSVFKQKYPKIEHIVVDGCSDDNTLKVLEQHENKYNLIWKSEHDDGHSDAVNKGFRLVKGDIVGWINSDDVYFDVNVFRDVVNFFIINPEVDVLYGDGVVINEEGRILKVNPSYKFSYSMLRRGQFFYQPSTFFRKDVIQKYELDVDIDLPMDYEFFLRMASDGLEFKYFPRIISAYRLHSATKTHIKAEKAILEKKEVQKKFGQEHDLNYKLLVLADLALSGALRIYGTKEMARIHSKDFRKNIAFSAKFDPITKAIFKQLWIKNEVVKNLQQLFELLIKQILRK